MTITLDAALVDSERKPGVSAAAVAGVVGGIASVLSMRDSSASSLIGLSFKNISPGFLGADSLMGVTGALSAGLLLGKAVTGFKTGFVHNPAAGVLQKSFAGAVVDAPIGVVVGASGLGVPSFLGDATKHIGASAALMSSARSFSQMSRWITAARPELWIGDGERTRDERIDKSVDAWLLQLRPDLVKKRRGMWQAIEHSPDPVLQAATSAVELVKHLLIVSGVSDREVVIWAKSGARFADDAVDTSQGYERVTWIGRLRLASIRAGYDEVGQEFILTLGESGRILQRMKHDAHQYDIADVEPHLRRVDELLSLLAWRL